MGYLSCRADSSISTCRSISSAVSPSQSHSSKKQSQTNTRSNRREKQEEDKPYCIQHFTYSELESATNNFSPSSLLGRGSHGSVYKATLSTLSATVAVKRPSSRLTTTTPSDEPQNEIQILTQIRCPRLVNLLGFTPNTPHPLLVFEFMPNGTLFDLLHSNPCPPSWPRRLRLALQTATALLTLHSYSPPIIHRDVKAANVLLDRSFNARLADFGLALRLDGGGVTPPAGTLGYLDPSYVTPDNLSTKTDVFSFGILLLEIMSGRRAIDVAHSPPSVVEWAVPLLRRGKVAAIYDPRISPPKDSRFRRQLAVLAASCVRSHDERRPVMEAVVEQLKVLSKAVNAAAAAKAWNPCAVVETEGTLLKEKPTNRATNASKLASETGSLNSSVKAVQLLRVKKGVNLMELMARPEREIVEFCGGKSSVISRARTPRVNQGQK